VLPQIFRLLGGSLRHMVEIIEGLEVHPERMAANIDATHGLVLAEAVSMALAEKIGRAQAHHLVELASHRAVARSLSLRAALEADPAVTAQLDAASLDRLLDPAQYLGQSAAFTARVLASYRSRISQEGRKT
jgi:3-carboxy-cis,cis-muconate cycloisomerase